MADSTWTSEDSKVKSGELAKALLVRISGSQLMKVDNNFRKAAEQLASPSQGWIVLWVQYENYDNWLTEIKFDLHLKGDLLKLAKIGDR